MSDLFDFLFSPFGCVGRRAWWLTQIVFIVVLVLALISRLSVAEQIFGVQTWRELLGVLTTFNNGSFAGKEQIVERMQAGLPAVRNEVLIIGLLVTLATWTWFVVELKRWQDRGMSGWWFLLHFAYGGLFYLGVSLEIAKWVGFCVIVFRVVELGIFGEASNAPVHRPRRSAHVAGGSGAPVRSMSIAVPLAMLALFLLLGGGVVAAFIFGWAPGWIAGPVDSAYASSGNGKAAVSYHGAGQGDFARDWVVIGGSKLTGITDVHAMAGGQVAITSASGPTTAPAASLPEGFLYEWKITPDVLKAADH